jgi:flagellar motor switch protein FliM
VAKPVPGTVPEETVAFITAQGRREQRARSLIRKHDFRQSAFLAPSELRWFRLRHEQYVRTLAARLSLHLRMEVTVQLSKLHVANYQQFIDGLSGPISASLFKAEPLNGICLLVIPPRLGLTCVDRLLGGPGHPPDTNRELSEIETALLDQVVLIILTEWCNHWQDTQNLKASLLGHESSSRFLQTAPSDTAMVLLTLDVGFGGTVEPMQIVFPYYTVEPFVRNMNPRGANFRDTTGEASATRWNPEFDSITTSLTAEWQGLGFTAVEMSRLKTGDVLLMPPQNASQVRVRISSVPKYQGRLGTCGQNWAVELTAAL